MRAVLFVALAGMASVTWGQQVYKCPKDAGGYTFQDHPCPGTKFDRDTVRPAPPPAAAATPMSPVPATSASTPPQPYSPKDTLARLQRERRVRELQQADADLASAIDRRNVDMVREMDAVKAKKSRANNNLAGATWEQSLSTEMTAIAEKYRAMNDVDLARQKQIREELVGLQRGG